MQFHRRLYVTLITSLNLCLEFETRNVAPRRVRMIPPGLNAALSMEATRVGLLVSQATSVQVHSVYRSPCHSDSRVSLYHEKRFVKLPIYH